MSEMHFDGVEEPEKKKPADVPLKPVIDAVMQCLNSKENKGKFARVATTAANKADAKKDMDELRRQMKQCGYKNLSYSIKDLGDNKFCLLAAKSKAKKKKGGKAGKNAPVDRVKAAPGFEPVMGKDLSFEERKNKMLETVKEIPLQVLPNFIVQQQTFLQIKQARLTAQGVTEAEAARLKEDIQIMQETLEAAQKRMSGQ